MLLVDGHPAALGARAFDLLLARVSNQAADEFLMQTISKQNNIQPQFALLS